MNKKIIFIFLILILALGSSFYLWKQSSYSKETVKLEILGPQSVALGDKMEYVVKFKNNGNVRVENPELSFEFPPNSILEGNERIQRMSSSELKGDVYPGEERSFVFSARLLGKENEAKVARATLTFQPKGLSTRNEVSTTFATIVQKAALNFTLDFASSKVSAGKNFTFSINYLSNVPYPLTNLTCKIEYPGGFNFVSSKPKDLEQTQWNIDSLNEGEGGKIEISGSLSGQAKDQKIFKAQIGVWQDGDFISLQETSKIIGITAPDLYISQQINGSPQYTAVPGDLLHYEISFANVGEESLTDLTLISRLNGKGFDFSSIKAPEGNFTSGDNSIIWDGQKIPQLRYLEKGETGKVEFWVELKDGSWTMQSPADKNPEISNKIFISQAVETFTNRVASTLNGRGELSLDGKYFASSGSLPLSPGQSNTFAAVWKISDSFNDVKNVKIRTVLPEGVSFTGKLWPTENSGITYDSQSREILWQVGDLTAGSGILTEAKVCAFQLSIAPKAEDTGKDITVLDTAQISGEDQWTNTSLYSEIQPLQAKIK
jgi:hypothetical protein